MFLNLWYSIHCINLYFSFKLKVDEKTSSNDKKSIFFIWPILIFLLAIIAMANALTEGSVDSWGALYMKDYIQVSGFKVGIATISFNIFMVIGRLCGDWIRDKIGVYKLLIIFQNNNFCVISPRPATSEPV